MNKHALNMLTPTINKAQSLYSSATLTRKLHLCSN